MLHREHNVPCTSLYMELGSGQLLCRDKALAAALAAPPTSIHAVLPKTCEVLMMVHNLTMGTPRRQARVHLRVEQDDLVAAVHQAQECACQRL